MSVVLSCLGQEFHRAVLSKVVFDVVRNRWEIYTSRPYKQGWENGAVSSMIWKGRGGGGGFAVSFFMILSKIVAPWVFLYSDDLLA